MARISEDDTVLTRNPGSIWTYNQRLLLRQNQQPYRIRLCRTPKLGQMAS